MAAISHSKLLAALHALTGEEINGLRLKLWKRYGTRLRKIPNAPDPDDLLHEAIEDLLADRRHCPPNLSVSTCLFHIVRSKTSHFYEKQKTDEIVTHSDEFADTVRVEHVHEPELRQTIITLIHDDALLTRIVAYRLEHCDDEPIKARTIAEVLGVGIRDIYNANRRLRTRLEKLVS